MVLHRLVICKGSLFKVRHIPGEDFVITAIGAVIGGQGWLRGIFTPQRLYFLTVFQLEVQERMLTHDFLDFLDRHIAIRKCLNVHSLTSL